MDMDKGDYLQPCDSSRNEELGDSWDWSPSFGPERLKFFFRKENPSLKLYVGQDPDIPSDKLFPAPILKVQNPA